MVNPPAQFRCRLSGSFCGSRWAPPQSRPEPGSRTDACARSACSDCRLVDKATRTGDSRRLYLMQTTVVLIDTSQWDSGRHRQLATDGRSKCIQWMGLDLCNNKSSERNHTLSDTVPVFSMLISCLCSHFFLLFVVVVLLVSCSSSIHLRTCISSILIHLLLLIHLLNDRCYAH